MIHAGRIRAFVQHHPWMDAFELRLVHDVGNKIWAATEIVNGQFKYEEIDEAAEVDSVLRLGEAEIDALLEALKQHAKPIDATVDALRDTREVRDRLLTIVEKTTDP